MAITASFAADFSAFSSEVKKAEGDLEHFQGETTQTATAIGKMGTASTTTAGPVNTLQQSFRQFDGVLAAAGIHISPVIKGIEDVAAAAGKSAGQLGLLASAGLVVGTAMAAWNFGRMIAEWTGADAAISKATASLLGWGDAAAQTAGAKADVLALATQRAGREITNFSEALRINQKWVDDHKKAATEAAEALKAWTKANEEVTIATQDWGAVLNTINGTIVEAAKAALEAGVSQKTVATAYELTAAQIAAVKSALDAEKQALKESEAEHARITAELKKHWDGVLAIRDRVFGKDAVEQAQQWMEAIHALGGTLDGLTNDQLRELAAAMNAGIDAMARSGQLTSEQSSEFATLALAAQQALAALQPLVNTWDDIARAEYEAATAADAAAQALSKSRDEAKALADQVQQSAQQMSGVFAGGAVPTAGSLTNAAMRPGSFLGFGTGQMIQSMPTSVANLPWNTFAQAPSYTVQSGAVTVNYPIMNDPAALDQLGNLVGDAMMSRITRTGTRV